MTSIPDRNALRIVSVMQEIEEHYIQAVMMGHAIGQEEPVWLSVEEDGDPPVHSRLLVVDHGKKLVIIERYITAKHLGSFSHFLFIPAAP